MSQTAPDGRFFDVLSSILNVRRELLDRETSRDTLEEWDSVKHIYLMLALEEEFGIQFSDDEIVGLSDASGLLDTIAARCAGQLPEARSA